MRKYPIIIPTLCRYTHFVRCIESLSNAERSNEIDCYVALDFPLNDNHKEGYLKIKEYLRNFKHKFNELIVIERTENYGAVRNLHETIDLVKKKYHAYMLTEDDNEFSPCFFDYMIKCLEQYKDDDSVYSVCGYATPEYKDITDRNIIFTLGNSAYGVAYWTSKDRKYDSLTKDYYYDAMTTWNSWMKLYKLHKYFVFGFTYCILHDKFYGDGTLSCYSYLENKYQIKPRVSLVRNWGCDGSGLHSGYDPSISKREISAEKVFNLDPNEPVVLNKDILLQMEREAAAKSLKSRIHQEVGAIYYPMLLKILRLLKIK